MEAMSAECLVVAARTAPVEEVVDGSNAYLVDFFDTEAMAERICTALSNPADAEEIRRNARRTVVEQYDLKTRCLPEHLALIGRLAGMDPVPVSRPRRAAARKPALVSAR